MKAQAQDISTLLQGIIEQFINKYDDKSIREVAPAQTSSFGSKVLSLAQADLGVHEDLGKNDGKRIRQYFKYFNMGAKQDWCAAAVSAWMKEAGGGPIAGAVGARQIGEQFRQIDRWVPKNKITASAMIPGNIVVWARGGPDSTFGHIGVLESFDNHEGFISIEGNSGPRGDSVVRNHHSIHDGNLLGIGQLTDKTSISHIIELVNKFYKLAVR